MDPSRNRIPPIVPGLQSRRGSTSVAPSVRHENSTINAWYSDSPAGAVHSRSALASTDTRRRREADDARVPPIHRHQNGRRTRARPIATAVRIDRRAKPSVCLPVGQGSAWQSPFFRPLD